MSRIQIIIDSIAGAVGAVLGFMYGEVNGLFRGLCERCACGDSGEEAVKCGRLQGDSEKAADTCVPVGRSYCRHICAWRCACRYDGGNAFLYC